MAWRTEELAESYQVNQVSSMTLHNVLTPHTNQILRSLLKTHFVMTKHFNSFHCELVPWVHSGQIILYIQNGTLQFKPFSSAVNGYYTLLVGNVCHH